MANVLVQTVFQGVSGQAEDRYVTTTHWSAGAPLPTFEETAEAAIAKLRAFWETDPPVGPPAVGAFIPSHVLRAYQLRAYNQDLPVNERVPYVVGGTLPTVPSSDGAMPSEVALVVSYVSGAPPFAPGDRGRFYIGPLTAGASTGRDSGAEPAQPAQILIDAICSAANRMRDLETPDQARWMTRSTRVNKADRATPLYQEIVGGWVDDAFDTQRRRGERATGRTTWGVLPS